MSADAETRRSPRSTADRNDLGRQGVEILALLKDAIERSTGRFGLIVVMSVLASALESAALIVLPSLVGLGRSAMPWRTLAVDHLGLWSLLAIYVLLVGLAAVLLYAQNVASTRLTLEFGARLRARLHAAILRAGWGTAALDRPAGLVHALTAEASQCAYATQTAINLATRLVYLPSLLTAALILSPRLAVAALCLAALAGLPMLPLARRAYALAKNVVRVSKRFHGDIADELAGLKTIKVLQAEAARRAAFRMRLGELNGATLTQTRATAAVQAWQRFAAATTAAGGAFYGISVLHLDGAAMLALTIALARLAMNLSQVLDTWRQLGRLLPVYTQFRACEEQCRLAEEPAAAEAPRLRHQIRLDGVAFAHRDEQALTLAGLNLTLHAFSINVLTGPSGSGKSTLADLVMGLVLPAAGSIAIDGIRLDGGTRIGWRARVAQVGQEPFLFHDTIRANLSLADPNARDADLVAALDAAGASFVLRLPKGLDTMVGERGSRLSGGERQRLMLARALLRRPDLLVLDEATNALDPISEAEVIASLSRLKSDMTILAIAHRSAIMEVADRVLVLDRGVIRELDHDPMTRPAPETVPPEFAGLRTDRSALAPGL